MTTSTGLPSRNGRGADAPSSKRKTGRPSLPSALLKALEDAFLDQARALREERERESLEERRMIETLEAENRRLESQTLELEASLRKKTEEEQRGEGRIAEIRRTCESLERLLERERAERLRAEKQAAVLEGGRNGLREQIADLRERLTTTFPGRPRTNKSPSSGKPSPTRIKRRTEGPDPGNP